MRDRGDDLISNFMETVREFGLQSPLDELRRIEMRFHLIDGLPAR